MINIFLRTAILYVVALFVIRVMGKGELSKMDPFQLVALFMIAELATLAITSPDVSVITGVSAMIGLLLIQIIISILSVKSPAITNIVKGKASIIIEKGRVNEKVMKKYRITIDDLSQQLRIKNYPSIADVEYAILEANGDMSVIPKPEKGPVTKEDLGIPTGVEGLPMVLIADGMLCRKNLLRSSLDEETLRQRLAARGITDYSQVFLSFIDENGLIYIHPKTKISSEPNNAGNGPRESDMQ
ncbi:MAG: YetF domain-containing protein [Anaerovoracaceae bacterium]